MTNLLLLADVAAATGSIEGWWVGLLATFASAALAALAWLLVQLQRKVGADATATRTVLIAARLAHFAEVVVRAQTPTVDALKRATADGKLSSAEATAVLGTALDEFKKVAGPALLIEAQEALRVAAPSLDFYLRGLLEGAVARTKAPLLVTASPSIPPNP